jgi:sarcosine oxidase subunit gamma
MSDNFFDASTITLAPRRALTGKPAITRDGVTIEPSASGYILHIMGKPSDAGLLDFVRTALDATSLRFVAPGQWFTIGDAALTPDSLRDLAARLSPRADVVDQSHGRVRIAITGVNARRVLANGTAVDLSPGTFKIGQSAMTLIGHIGAQITRVADDRFEVIVLRGFAESLWDELGHMSRQFI